MINLSPSALHHRFKAVTAMSPLQYQKQLRLQEARRLLLAENSDVSSIGYKLGYESPSQFSREYSRLLAPPEQGHRSFACSGAASQWRLILGATGSSHFFTDEKTRLGGF